MMQRVFIYRSRFYLSLVALNFLGILSGKLETAENPFFFPISGQNSEASENVQKILQSENNLPNFVDDSSIVLQDSVNVISDEQKGNENTPPPPLFFDFGREKEKMPGEQIHSPENQATLPALFDFGREKDNCKTEAKCQDAEDALPAPSAEKEEEHSTNTLSQEIDGEIAVYPIKVDENSQAADATITKENEEVEHSETASIETAAEEVINEESQEDQKEKETVSPSSEIHETSEKTSPKEQVKVQKLNLFAEKAPYIAPEREEKLDNALKSLSVITAKKEPKAKEEEKEQTSDEKEILAQTTPPESEEPKTPPKSILINFNDVNVIEYIRFISRLTNRNFIFDETDLQFNVTIISEEPTTIENVMTALIQALRIHGLQLIEEGNNYLIHRNDKVRSITRVSVDEAPTESPRETEIVTQVFRLNTLAPEQAQSILRQLLSEDAILNVANETRHIIVTDLVSNIKEVEKLLKSIDAPVSGMVLGQYVVRNAFMDNLIELARRIMEPIAQGQILTFVPHNASNSIFIVSSPFLVERTISVLQHLDTFRGMTRIYDLEDLKFKQIEPPVPPPGVAPTTEGVTPEGERAPRPGQPRRPGRRRPRREGAPGERKTPPGRWELTPEGEFIFRPGFRPGTFTPRERPPGSWQLDPQGNWYFVPDGEEAPFDEAPEEIPETLPGEAPRGRWVLDPEQNWIFQLSPGEALQPARLARTPKFDEDLPIGHIDRTKFFIYKLQYRLGLDIVNALEGIAISLQLQQGAFNEDLILAIQSVQWLEPSNSLIITGTGSAIEKVRELIKEIDIPLRQVLIEMLILQTTITDSLNYGVSWATKSGGGNTATAQAFIGTASPLVPALATSGITDGAISFPSATSILGIPGYNLGIIGQRITHNGTQFATLGALVQAVHMIAETKIVQNPKIVTEDNKTAEIFVGVNSPFLSNSIANDEGSIVTTNVEFRDTGTTLRVTPLISHGDIITLEIEQEVSSIQSTPQQMQQVNLTPTTNINRTTTTVHVPDKHFVILSGLMQDQDIINTNQFPCLGGIPIIGAAFKMRDNADTRMNLMVFIRPEIIDTSEEYTDITRRQQDIFKQKNRLKKSWKYEVDEALEFMNLEPPCCDDCE